MIEAYYRHLNSHLPQKNSMCISGKALIGKYRRAESYLSGFCRSVKGFKMSWHESNRTSGVPGGQKRFPSRFPLGNIAVLSDNVSLTSEILITIKLNPQ